MASPSVGETQHPHKLAKDAQKGRGRFGWLRSRRDDDVDPAPFFTEPAPTQRLARAQAAAQSPTRHSPPPVVHRDHATDPDDIAVNLIGISAWGLKHKVSSTVLHAELAACWAELTKRAEVELEKAKAAERRPLNSVAIAERTGHALAGAVAVAESTGAPLPDPKAVGKALAAVADNTTNLAEQTMVGLPRITDAMSDPRAAGPELAVKSEEPGTVVLTVVSGVPSPVHQDGDGSTPPMPDGPAVEAQPLPCRESKPATDTAQPEGGEPR